ncbi:MAG: PPC domain-containing DNA-binding protein [Myxococcota bacterium]|nr:PPC domain-containing DNA-binding protein [Myxococcota bacterium]
MGGSSMSTAWTTLELVGIDALRLKPGDDLRSALEELQLSAGGGAILTCVGSLSRTQLRMAGAKDIWVSEKPVEIVSLVGTLSQNGVHLHLSVSLPSGQVIGGHLMPGTLVRTTAEIVVAQLGGAKLVRRPDHTTGFKELCFEER